MSAPGVNAVTRALGGDEGDLWPSPPHDPRERVLAVTASGWDVRLFGERELTYFVKVARSAPHVLQ